MTNELNISKRTFIICGIVRNAERGLRHNIPVIKSFCSKVKDYKVIVFENNSKDKTKQLLKEWAGSNKHVLAFCEDRPISKGDSIDSDVNPFYSRERIGKMVGLRNQYMDFIAQHNLSADYLMVVDLDVSQLKLEGILSSFCNCPEWDVVTAYGYSLSPQFKQRYHDSYALVELNKENIPQTECAIKALSDHYAQLLRKQRWIEVYSAYGGLAIYRYDKVKGLRYQLIDNNDPRVEVRCEHFSLAKQMKDRGSCHIYINSGMILKYQSVSLSLVKRKLIRMLRSMMHSEITKSLK
jgi:hypothetical protein